MRNDNNSTEPCCTNCGVASDDLVELGNGDILCEDCLEKLGYVQCDDCGNWFKRDELTEVSNGDVVCEDCLDDNYFKCADCGEWCHNDTEVTVNPGCYDERQCCESCTDSDVYFTCCECDEVYTRRHLYGETSGGSCICDSCSDDYNTCNDCGYVFNEDEGEWDSEGDYWYCYDCASRHRRYVHDYSFKPYPEFKKRNSVEDQAPGVYTFGVELEIDEGCDYNDCARELCECTDAIYLKHDGSLGSAGIEIVTHPCTLAYHRYEMPWRNICKTAISHGYRSHETSTCGLHVHVGRNELGSTLEERNATAAKVVLLVERHWDSLVPFTRRSESRLDQWAARPYIPHPIEGTDEGALLRAALSTECNGRYQGVNLQNYNTVEFRIFRGTLKRDTLLASIQLVNNICAYAQHHSVAEVLASQWPDLLGEKHFTELHDYCAAKNLLEGRNMPAETVSSATAGEDTATRRRVVICTASDLVSEQMIGETGVLVEEPHYGSMGLLAHGIIMLDTPDHPSGHECRTNAVTYRNAYYVDAENIRPLESGPRVGDRVRLISTEVVGPAELYVGMLGTVRVGPEVANSHYAPPAGLDAIGVEFDACLHGLHNLDGACPYGHGYFMSTTCVEVVPSDEY